MSKMRLEYEPGDIRNVFAAVSNFSVQVARLNNIARLKREADKTDEHRCGNCNHWMKSRVCPREHHDGSGYSKGPSCDAWGCGQFEIQQWVVDLKAKRIAEVERLLAEYKAAEAEEAQNG